MDLEIESGSFTTLLGPSGCGKTTLLREIAGFLDPNDGRIAIDGRDQVGVPPNRRPTSIVFQDDARCPHLAVFDDVAYGPRAQGTPKRQARKRVVKALDLIGVRGFARRCLRELSGGQQQRVALGGSIAVMNSGRVDQYGSPEDVFYRPSGHFVADFIGLPVVMLLPIDDVRVARSKGICEGVVPDQSSYWPRLRNWMSRSCSSRTLSSWMRWSKMSLGSSNIGVEGGSGTVGLTTDTVAAQSRRSVTNTLLPSACS